MRRLTRIIFYCLAAVLVLLLACTGYVYFNREELKQELLTTINKSLETEVTVGHIGIDIFHSFPKVGLDLEDVKVKDAFKRKTYLLDARHIYIGFDLWDLINKNYRIRQILAEQGEMNLLVMKNGKENYMIIKSDSVSDSHFLLDLQDIKLRAINVIYDDKYRQQLYETTLENLELAVKLENKLVTAKARGGIFVEKMRSGKTLLLQSKKVNVDGSFEYNSGKRTLVINTTAFGINKLQGTLIGRVTNAKNHTDVDLSFKAREMDIPSMLSLLPDGDRLGKDWESDGRVYFSGTIKGRNSRTSSPVTEITFGIENGSMENSRTGTKIGSIECKGRVHNRSGQLILLLRPLSFVINESSFKGELDVTRFDDPIIAGKLDCHFKAADLIRLAGIEWCKSADGQIDADIIFAGPVKSFSDKNKTGGATASGSIRADLADIKLSDADKDIESLTADMTLEPSGIVIHKLTASVDQSDISITGKLENVFGYVLQDQTLTASINYHSNFIDPNHFVIPAAQGNKNEQSSFALPRHIILDASTKIDKFVYGKFSAAQVKGNIRWRDGRIDFSGVSAVSMNGRISLAGQIATSADNRYLATITGTTENIDIRELFRQCKNFGQEEITEQHLRGILSSTFDLTSVWSEQWKCDMNNLYMNADVTINNGEIINYAPMEKLSRFASVEDLKNLKFASLHNKIYIKEQTITIPEMEIRNNALNITLSGTHTFKNYLDYRLKLRLSELLKKKRKPAENEFGEEEEKEKGLNLYLTMKGPINDLKIAYDKTAVKNKMKEDIRIEKQTIREILKKELGIGRDTTIREKTNDNDEDLEFEKE